MSIKINSLSTILTLASLLVLSACVNQQAEEKGKSASNSTIVIRESAEPSTINPFYVRDELGFYICSQIFQPLLAIDYQSEELVGVLAKARPSISSSNKWKMIITYELKESTAFGTNKPLKYEDILYSIKANISSIINPYYSSYYQFIDSVAVSQSDSSRFSIYSNELYFLSEFTSGDYFILSESQFDSNQILRNYSIKDLKEMDSESATPDLKDYAKWIEEINFTDSFPPLGSGAYRLHSWTNNEKMSLAKKVNWWADKYSESNTYMLANAQGLDFLFIEDAVTATNALKNSKFDVMRAIPVKDYQQLKENPSFLEKYTLKTSKRFAYQYLGYNFRSPLLKSLDLRKAIAFSLPKKAIIKNVYYGLATEATTLSNQLDETNSEKVNKYTAILDSAKYYFDRFASKNPNSSLELNYAYNTGNDKRKAIGLILKESLKPLGINLTINQYEWAVYLEKLRAGEFDLFLHGVVNSSVTPDMSNSFHSSAIDGGRNYFGFKDEKADQLLEAIKIVLDQNKRESLFNELNLRINQLLPILPIAQPMETIAFSKKLRNANAYRLRPNYWAAEIIKE